MKRFLFSLALAACMPLCAWSAPAAQDPNLWDFGVVKAGVVLEHTFVIVNDSARDLTIKDSTTSCGCTVSEIKKKQLKPMESSELLIKFDTKGYSGATRQFVYVNTDNIDVPIVRFTVKANVVP